MKKKRAIVAAIAVAGIAVIGGTFAFYADQASFSGIFNLGSPQVEFTETFESPNYWKSCDVTPKTLIITNKTDYPVKARFKMEQYWKASGSTSTDHTTELPLQYQNADVAIIGFQNDDDWEFDGEWYTYKTTLQKGESTNSLLKDVTFNCTQNFAGSIVYSDDGSTGYTAAGDYTNAKFHLFITAQTNQVTE